MKNIILILFLSLTACGSGAADIELVARNKQECLIYENALEDAIYGWHQQGVEFYYIGCSINKDYPDEINLYDNKKGEYYPKFTRLLKGSMSHWRIYVVDSISYYKNRYEYLSYGGLTYQERYLGNCLSLGAIAKSDPHLIGHEMGHFAGLGHKKNKDNLMFPSVGFNLTQKQVDKAQQGMIQYNRMCGDPGQ